LLLSYHLLSLSNKRLRKLYVLLIGEIIVIFRYLSRVFTG